MPSNKPNVLFLSVDALRADRTTVHGYNRPTTPTLQKMSEDAILCDNAYSAGAFTSIAFPTIFTSSPPLSYDGFDNGIENRPKTLFQAFKDAGYRTVMLSTVHWVNRFFGYGKGVDHEEMLYSLNVLANTGMVNLKNDIAAYKDGAISSDDLTESATPFINRAFDSIEEYCSIREQADQIDRTEMPTAMVAAASHNYKSVRRIVARHRQEFARDHLNYVLKIVAASGGTKKWLSSEWHYSRAPIRLIEELYIRFTNIFVGFFSPARALLRKNRYNRYIDASELADRVIKHIRQHDTTKPFFIWTHFFDTHTPYCAGTGKDWFMQTPSLLRELGYDENIDISTGLKGKPSTSAEWSNWSALYDAAVKHVDNQIARILAALEEAGLRDNTIVVVCGDHGEELGEHGDISHHYRLYEHNLRVPLLFHAPGISHKRINSMTSLMDLAPTLAQLCGVPPIKEWEGESVSTTQVENRDHMLIETFHGSPCRFDRRPVYIAVRYQNLKYIWKEYRDPTDAFSPEGLELFDIEKDPLEQNNIYTPDHPDLPYLNSIVIQRLRQLPDHTEERLQAMFGAVTVSAADAAMRGRSKE